MPDLSTITTDISSNFSNINFSYPEVNIDENIKSGYLELFGNSSYLHFNYDSIKIDITNKMICVIHKSLDNTKTAYIVFNYEYSSGADRLYNKPYIHLNHHIANEIIEGSTLKYDSTGFYILGNNANSPTSYLIYFKDTILKLNTDNIPDTIIGTITVPSPTTGTKLFKRGMFKNDEIDCDESTVGSAESSVTGTGQIKPLSKSQAEYTYYGIALIMGMLLVHYGILVLFTNRELRYRNNTKLFSFFPDGFESKAVVYCTFTVLAFIMSFVFFVLYGIFGPSTKNPSFSYWYYLAFAIFYLLAFISYLWWKVTYLTLA
jgi:hypothetical protein